MASGSDSLAPVKVNVKRVLRTTAGILVGGAMLSAFYQYVFTGSVNPQNFDPTNTSAVPVPTFRLIGSAVAMLIGILFGGISSRLGKKSGAVSVRREFVEALVSPQMFKSLLAAPAIYSGVYLAAGSQPDVVLSMIFAFQNGFFCDSVMRLERKHH